MRFESHCDEAFIEEVEGRWHLRNTIDASAFPRLLAIAKRCKSLHRVEAENEWLRKRIDDLTKTDLANPEIKNLAILDEDDSSARQE